MDDSIFISFASSDRSYAERIISFLEMHNLRCWVSFRDVGAGENYQESITRALRAAKAIILIISRNANLSAEIPKELSLASRYKVAVVPLRIENVEPSDALAYELSTRQWVDLFENWNAGCQRLLSQLSARPSTGIPPAAMRAAASPSSARTAAPAAARPVSNRAATHTGTPSPALAQALAAPRPARRANPGGATFVAPRPIQLTQPAAAREAAPTAGPSAAGTPAAPEATAAPGSLPASRAPTISGAPSAPQAAPAKGLIAAVKFLLVAGVLGVLTLSWFQRGEPSPLELFFWAILLIGCARLLGAMLRLLVGGLRPNRA